MYRLVAAQHQLLDKWRDTFAWLVERWGADQDAEWQLQEGIRPEFLAKLTAANVPEGPSYAQLEKLFAWLDRSTDSDRRELLDENARERFFRGLLTERDEDLFDFFTFLYQPLDGDQYWNESVYLIFENRDWRDYYANQESADTTPDTAVPTPTPEELTGDIMDRIAIPALSEAVASNAVIRAMSPAQCQELLIDVLVEKISAKAEAKP